MKKILSKTTALFLSIVLLFSLSGVFALSGSVMINNAKNRSAFSVISPLSGVSLTSAEAKSAAVSVKAPLKTTLTAADGLNSYRTGDSLEGLAKLIYDSVMPQIESVANGGLDCVNTGLMDISTLLPSGSLDEMRWNVSDYSLDENDPNCIWNATGQAVENLLNSITPNESDSKKAALTSVLCDAPNDLFWFDKTYGMESGYSYQLMGDGVDYYISTVYYVVTFHVAGDFLDYYETDSETGLQIGHVKSTAATDYATAKSNAQEIISAAENMSDYEKLKFYHDKICELTGYNTPASKGKVDYGNPWQMLYVFDGDPSTTVVCEGYSKAFKYLCDNSYFSDPSLSCLVVSGMLYQNDAKIGGHMWNIVIINGMSYHVDVTNDDNDNSSRITYDLFLTVPDSGEVNGIYKFNRNFENVPNMLPDSVSYKYDGEMFIVYPESVLTMASADYEPGNSADPGTDSTSTGYSNANATIVWEKTITQDASGSNYGSMLVRPADGVVLPDAAHPDFSVMDDYEYIGTGSSAPWVAFDPAYVPISDLNELTVESGITRIGAYSFADQTALAEIHLYPTLKEIGNGAFYNCYGITKIIFHGTPSQWNAVTIGTDNDALLAADITCTEEETHEHTWGEWTTVTRATCTANGEKARTCSGCNETQTEVILATGHNFVEKAEDKFLKSAADCTHSAVYFKSCSRCGILNTETFVYGRPAGHIWNTVWMTDGTSHWHACTRCTVIKDYAAHVYDNESDETCNVCGAVRTVTPVSYDPKITVESKTVRPGEEFSLSITLSGAPDMSVLGAARLAYNQDVFSLESVNWAVNGAVLESWDAAEGNGLMMLESERNINGVIMILSFKVREDVTEGDYSFGMVFYIPDAAGVNENIEVIPGVVSVKNYLPGDLDGDEEITDADAIYLLFHTFFPEDYPVSQSCDYNGDGTVTDEDAIYLLFYTFFPDDYPLYANTPTKNN